MLYSCVECTSSPFVLRKYRAIIYILPFHSSFSPLNLQCCWHQRYLLIPLTKQHSTRFSLEEVVFLPAALAKQSRQGKPLKEFNFSLLFHTIQSTDTQAIWGLDCLTQTFGCYPVLLIMISWRQQTIVWALPLGNSSTAQSMIHLLVVHDQHLPRAIHDMLNFTQVSLLQATNNITDIWDWAF